VKRAAAWLLLVAPLTALAADELPPLRDAPAEYARHAAAAPPCADGDSVALAVAADTKSGIDATYDAAGGRLRILYRMGFNQLTEGWNWHPELALAGDDYYTFKYLPLASIEEDRGGYRAEDKIGAPQDFRVQWRTDYFFAFDNPYEFYPHEADDDIGFAAEVAASAADAARLAGGDLRMALSGRLDQNCLSDSTTFWKATSAKPVDFTLKKRYLIGKLAAIWFYDAAGGRVLARLEPRK
jgi:hypothetical protein